ncbi:ParB/RepB/Spo0J family partition protein [Psychromonas sp. Urea-02u-13]|uniref:ParB/RepB/Spo0J family partition protein n=1 Tax=Psychromonas sp. Urea-02u-13 TaxID=2058326 RepID=UPI000C32D476|nr:ParB/RepB/Spo0J family partition protein [Psychromonas sp. Urea-02u-13]PKG40183.1 chromosome partitioning protein ParB [Psychromonas sp. Urea-02u-13]
MLGKKRGLGKGLDSLLSSSTENRNKQVSHDFNAQKTQQLVDDVKGALQDLNIQQLQPGKYQPRRDMSESALEELANSIHAQGIIQPIVVRETGHQKYEIIAGERRWRAAKKVGLESVPCLIKNVEDNAAIAIALIENIQRENLNAMEEAIAYKRLLEEFELTHNEVATAVGKSRTTVSNLLRLNNLNEDVKVLLEQGDIEMGHARALLSSETDKQSALAKIVAEKSLTVRETEKLVKKSLNPQIAKDELPLCDEYVHIINTFEKKFGLTVSAKTGKKGAGKLIINYDTLSDLDSLLEIVDRDQ